MAAGYSFTTLESIIASGEHDPASLGGRNFANRDYRVSFRCVADNPPPVDDVAALLPLDGYARLETGYRNAMRTPGYLANGIFTFEDYGFFDACAQPIHIGRREALMGEPICWGIDFADWHARTHNLADILDKSTGYLDQLMQKLRNQTVSGSAIVLSAPGQEIYGHWLLDVVPRLWTLNQAGHTTEPILFQGLPEWASYFLDIFDIDPARLRRHPASLFRVERALVPSASKSGFRLGTASLSAALAQVLDAHKPVEVPPKLVGEKIFFSRRKLAHSSRRSVVNIYAVEAEAARRGYHIVAPESLSVAQQIELMKTARIVVGEDGSALHNIVFAPKGAGLGVLNLPGRDNLWHLGLCQMLGHKAAYLDLPADPEWPLDLGRFNQLLDALENPL
ncbi:hypothetical protein ABI_20080 [Asticcacaulis biprosthecium C19]|uniref:Glycosyltransferase 61 catalytic domain-containing protein n=1 Tax=Asticcacaulis biprosthecium C19 TaxID=715226 RepID=F4QLZ6_9CAUL|nr:glycosyltransferase 61 family protein [Asticcacaulis biprosthecium]EGF93568.1 hypothetical protein ABI_20080 [Asticcacaulis biprosthecium C19]